MNLIPMLLDWKYGAMYIFITNKIHAVTRDFFIDKENRLL